MDFLQRIETRFNKNFGGSTYGKKGHCTRERGIFSEDRETRKSICDFLSMHILSRSPKCVPRL
jgi:hypothetical protein